MFTMATFNVQNQRWIQKNGTRVLFASLMLLLSGIIFAGCASVPSPSPEESAKKFIEEQTEGAVDGVVNKSVAPEPVLQQAQLPVRYQKLSYNLTEGASSKALKSESTPVGADYSPNGLMSLTSILTRMADLKKMNISWSSDVNKYVNVYVPTIRATDDFFSVIDNILRQYNYSAEVEGRTIVVKHKITKKFHIALPFLMSNYVSDIGGTFSSNLSLSSEGKRRLPDSMEHHAFNFWYWVKLNLDKILEIKEAGYVPKEQVEEEKKAETAVIDDTPVTTVESRDRNRAQVSQGSLALLESVIASPIEGHGYYTIDRPIGLITVTAPGPYLDKIESYLESLKSELYKQVAIEAKIVEVTLTNDDTTGVDWAELFTETFDFALDLSVGQIFKPSGAQNISPITIGTQAFDVVIDAMKEQGHVEILSNPKITVMNGQPAMISVGDSVTYVDKVESKAEDGVISYTISTDKIMNGLGLGVVATITDDNQVILNLTPVTSDLTLPIEYRAFGDNQIGLPVVNLRELNTIVRVKDGEMLVIGGLIDNTSTYSNDYVAGLGEIPALGQGFRTDGTVASKKELVILMRPRITSL